MPPPFSTLDAPNNATLFKQHHDDGEDTEEQLRFSYHKKIKIDENDKDAKICAILCKWGCIAVRVVNPFTHPEQIFSTGIKVEIADEEGADLTATFTPEQLAHSNSYQMIINHQLKCDTYVSELREVEDKVSTEQDVSCNDDTAVIKEEVIDILHSEFGDDQLVDLSKKMRLMKVYESGKAPHGPDVLPHFLYHEYTCDSSNGLLGFLQSGILVKCYMTIYLRPSSWSGESKTKCLGKASLCHLEHDDETLDKEVIPGKFDYSVFFWTIANFFDNEEFTTEAEATLTW
ncbi:hypothetical protein M422DRAFT_53731 [Sphaerobolus stellatus SS14]|uniref:Uncharacterized protein n=1 Tax=Sphaerobolus stellatus (strain SS14) TaxID=990650 RepID=A0A0C9UZE7_SPHS4|nr:hypothetical protein M422DRAFT_53731 [Sphaerobolus stellatus SS14]